MKSCFNSDIKITQIFGVNKEYYKKYGLSGHNGIDIIPTYKNKELFSIFGGKIISLYFNKSYGNRIVLWNNKLDIWECHNHLKEFEKRLKKGMYINVGEYIGAMGNTGDSHGDHNHFQIAKVNKKGERIEIKNGFFGYCDPIPYLEG